MLRLLPPSWSRLLGALHRSFDDLDSFRPSRRICELVGDAAELPGGGSKDGLWPRPVNIWLRRTTPLGIPFESSPPRIYNSIPSYWLPGRGDGAVAAWPLEKKQTTRRAGTLPGAIRGVPLPHHQLCTGQAPRPLGFRQLCNKADCSVALRGGGLSCGAYRSVSNIFGSIPDQLRVARPLRPRAWLTHSPGDMSKPSLARARPPDRAAQHRYE